ncbi:MAG: hypothetical protein ACRDPZ_13510 [Gaiellaceae bacterium]
MTALGRLGDILGIAVRMHGLPIGTVTGVLGDARFEHVLGSRSRARTAFGAFCRGSR